MEKTLVILKPDCMEAKRVGKVISRFEGEGFNIVDCKLAQLSAGVLEEQPMPLIFAILLGSIPFSQHA